MSIAFAIILVTIVGILGAVILVLAAKYMHVEEDPRVAEITACLAPTAAAVAMRAVPTTPKPLWKAVRL
mgnify:CR=1 FL=1